MLDDEMSSSTFHAVSGSSASDEDRFDREDVARLVRRAAEVTDVELASDRRFLLGTRDLIAVAEDVGVSQSAILIAVAEARAGVDHRRSLFDRMVGPRQIWAVGLLRRGNDANDDTIDRLADWLAIEQGLSVDVRSGGLVMAQPRTGLPGAASQALRLLSGRPGLGRARQVNGSVVAVGEVGTVCVVADVGNKRTEAVVGGTAIAGGVGAVTVTVAALTTPLVLLALPLGVVGGLATARALYRQNVRPLAGQIETTADAVVSGRSPEHPIERFVRTRLWRRRH